jgi:NAD(P)-dependent dehydrogenase (short-subunit alcohol dehydrogenase family)
VDILVNNAGVAPFGPTSETGEDTFDLAFDVNVKGPVLPDSRKSSMHTH